MSVKNHQWQKWDMEDWNEALFRHFFFDSDGEDRPVHRIPVTGDELLKVVGDSHADDNEVQEAFLVALRTPSHIQFNHRLLRYQIDPLEGWKDKRIPPFFVELAFSCLVASPPDGEIRRVGDFRYRLSLLMDHNRAVAHYPLENLAQLWEAFVRWLDKQRAAGSPYRRLELPPRDYRVRIGYSINLAFPSLKDLESLIRIFSANGLTDDPPIPTVFAIVGKAIHTFSNSFRRAYDEFREAYRDRTIDLNQYPFWGAVREAVYSVEATGHTEKEDEAAVKLVMDRGGLVLLLSDATREVGKGGLSFVEVDTDYGRFRNVLCAGREFKQGILSATQMMLQGRYRDLLSGKGWLSIRIAIQQGVLLFAKTERLSWELVFTRQEEGDYQALIKDSLAPAFLSAFPENQRPYPRKSNYKGWTEVEHFSGEWLASLQYDERSPLAEIRCLQPTVRRPRLSLLGGCPIDGGYLGIPECLPSVRAPFLTEVELVSAEPAQGADNIRLQKATPDSDEFTFPGNIETRLEGLFRLVGHHGDRVLVRRNIIFRPEIVVNDYARPTNPEAWLVEAGGPDVTTYRQLCSSEQSCSDPPEVNEHVSRTEGKPSDGLSIQYTPRTGVRDWCRSDAMAPPVSRAQAASDDFESADRLMEICGGLSMRRKGIAEGKFIELLKATLKVDYFQRWDVARAWIEAGYLDQLMSRKWRRTEYFARIPRFVLDQDGSQVRAALYGLATRALRSRVDVDLLEKGATRIKTLSFSEWVPPIPMWVAQDAKLFEEVAHSLALEEPTWVRPATDSLWRLSEVASSKGDPPRFYDCWGCWDWKKGWIESDTKPTGQGVEIARYLHMERPPFYEVLLDGEHVWWSTSRTWALLLAYDLLGVSCFAFSGSVQVVRSTSAEVYLPLPIGRYLAATCPITPGPVSDRPGEYCYQFQDPVERFRTLASVWGGTTIPIEELRRWGRWMLNLSKRSSANIDGRCIPLPMSLQQGLNRFSDIPEFQELCRIKFHPTFLPRLRAGITRFSRRLGD